MASLTVKDALTALVDAAADVLDPTPQRIIVQPGLNVAWDGCECGQVWVRVKRLTPVYPKDHKGRVAPAGCGPIAWDAALGLGVIRCLAGMADDGTPPSDMDVTADGLAMLDDYLAVKDLLNSDLLTRIRPAITLRPAYWEPIGPEGDCAGGEWALNSRIDCG